MSGTFLSSLFFVLLFNQWRTSDMSNHNKTSAVKWAFAITVKANHQEAQHPRTSISFYKVIYSSFNYITQRFIYLFILISRVLHFVYVLVQSNNAVTRNCLFAHLYVYEQIIFLRVSNTLIRISAIRLRFGAAKSKPRSFNCI